MGEVQKKLELKFYYVDGSEQFVTIKTDSIELAVEDYKQQITDNTWVELLEDNGEIVFIQTRNVINVTFKKI